MVRLLEVYLVGLVVYDHFEVGEVQFFAAGDAILEPFRDRDEDMLFRLLRRVLVAYADANVHVFGY